MVFYLDSLKPPLVTFSTPAAASSSRFSLQFALLILLGICLLGWATGRPRDAWAGAGKKADPEENQ